MHESEEEIFIALDENLSDTRLGGFRQITPKMLNGTKDLWMFTKTSGLKRMAASTSQGGVPCASPSVTNKNKAKKKAISLSSAED